MEEQQRRAKCGRSESMFLMPTWLIHRGASLLRREAPLRSPQLESLCEHHVGGKQQVLTLLGQSAQEVS